MPKISTCLWYNGQAEDAANFYTGLFNNSAFTGLARNPEGSPAGAPGTVLTTSFKLEGLEFMGLNGGPQFTFTPAISFFVGAETEKEIDALFARLSQGGGILMPLQKYPFSEKFAWVQDKYGLSWQLNLAAGRQKLTPFFTFVGDQHGKAEEAVNFYVSVFENSGVEHIARYGPGENGTEGNVKHASFTLNGQGFMAMESGLDHPYTFNEAISMMVLCENQQEVDDYWEKLSKGGEEGECGWLKDKYGVSWQIAPAMMNTLLQDKEKGKRVMAQLIKMKKLDIRALEEA